MQHEIEKELEMLSEKTKELLGKQLKLQAKAFDDMENCKKQVLNIKEKIQNIYGQLAVIFLKRIVNDDKKLDKICRLTNEFENAECVGVENELLRWKLEDEMKMKIDNLSLIIDNHDPNKIVFNVNISDDGLNVDFELTECEPTEWLNRIEIDLE